MGAAESASRPVSEQLQTPSSPSYPPPSFPSSSFPYPSSPYSSSPQHSTHVADSSASPRLHRIPTDHPLRSLLDAKVPPPTDPEDDFYLTLFTDFLPIARIWEPAKPSPLTPLVSQALATPSSDHATALSNSIRAATYHLRLEADGTLLGALYFARTVLTDLHRLARSPLDAYLALAAAPAERHLHPTDRIDLALSLRTQLIHAALQLTACRVDTALAQQFAVVTIPLLLLILSHEADVERQATNDDETHAITQTTRPLDSITFANAPEVIVSLLDVIVDAAAYTSLSNQLPYPRDGRSSSALFSKSGDRNAVSVWDAWDTLAMSVPAVHLRNGFADVVSAFATVSHRLKATPWLSDTNNASAGNSGDESMVSPRSARAESMSRAASSSSDLAIGSSLPTTPEDLSFKNDQNGDGTPKHRIPDGDAQRSTLETENTRVEGESAATRLVNLAEEALVLLNLLCRTDGSANENVFTKALCNMRDGATVAERVDGDDGNSTTVYSFSTLYEALGRWLADARAAPLAYLLLVRNRSFRTFALARTDPDVIVAPMLASLRARCGVGRVPADGRVLASVLLALTMDKGFCEAIDCIPVSDAWCRFIVDGVRLGGDRLVLSGAVLIVCARVVQQSLVARREQADVFLAGVCLGAMANIGKDVTGLHAFVADRVVCLVEFLGRRRKRVLTLVKDVEKIPVQPPRVRDVGLVTLKQGLHADSGKSGEDGVEAVRRNVALVERLSELIGFSLEVIVAILRARSTVAANRHLVYALMHREGVLEGENVGRCSIKARALVHVIGRMLHFFGEFVDRRENYSRDSGGDGAAAGGRGQVTRRDSAGGVGISVERVFQVIEENARVLPADIFEGVPACSFSYREEQGTDSFLRLYADSLLIRFWEDDPVGGEKKLGIFVGESQALQNCFIPAR